MDKLIDDHISFIKLNGSEIKSYLDRLGILRISVFREYPYLYEGTLEYERAYLAPLSESMDSLVVLVIDGDSIVGFSSATPLSSTHKELQIPFYNHNIEIGRILYLGELVLLPDYRRKGLGRRLMQENIQYAIDKQRFDSLALCAVDRSNYPINPPSGYRSSDSLWRLAGFVRAGEDGTPLIEATFSWRVVGETEESEHPMTFWTRSLR